ncbi:MAG: BCCT family transporter [Nitriliruptor sp.]|nr:MAG: BCCT family transporter [Nitriliruptor sp.]
MLPMSTLERAKEHVHPVVFPVSAGVILLFVLYGAIFSDNAEVVLGATRDWITANLGFFMIFTIAVLVVFCLWLAIGKSGDIRLGPDDAVPDFSYLTWFAMLFSAGMGIGLVFWGVAEPIMHFAEGPQLEAAEQTAREAMLLTYHHWGLGAWSVYAVLGLSLAYFGFRHNLPMTVRSALYPLIGNKIHGFWGNVVDILAIFGTMFGIATSLGLGVSQISAGLERVFDIPGGVPTQIALIAIITLAATISVVTGIDKGIRRLSELNITLAGLLMLFVIITGPTLLLLTAYFDNLGAYITNFFSVLFAGGTYEDPALWTAETAQGWYGSAEGWLADWTIFYWAWWISWAPFVGMFIARISRGRTIREFILGVLLVPTAVSFLWFTVMGNTALNLQLTGAADIVTPTLEQGADVSMFVMLENLPAATLTSIMTIIVVTLFFVTSSDSGSFVIDMIASGGSMDPPKGLRIFWATSEGVVAAVLLAAGGLGALQAGAIATGFPFAVVLLVTCVGVAKALTAEGRGRTVVRSQDMMVQDHSGGMSDDAKASDN